MSHAHTMSTLLTQLESELKSHGLWNSTTPSAEALSSQQPFAVDTLKLEQWLQFIFIPRMQFVLEQQLAIPAMSITPIAEQTFLTQRSLLTVLSKIDSLSSK